MGLAVDLSQSAIVRLTSIAVGSMPCGSATDARAAQTKELALAPVITSGEHSPGLQLKQLTSSECEDDGVKSKVPTNRNYASWVLAPVKDDDKYNVVQLEPVVSIENAPDNTRRIYAYIDIEAKTSDVWNVLLDYDNLPNVIPNLASNETLEVYEPRETSSALGFEELIKTKGGALLFQVGTARVLGIKFSARITLDVREWPEGLPDEAHYQGESGQALQQVQPRRYLFPRPPSSPSLPKRDISMISATSGKGDFRTYQAVWTVQALSKNATRLSFAVEISPHAYLPVSLIQGRIARDLSANLKAISEWLHKA